MLPVKIRGSAFQADCDRASHWPAAPMALPPLPGYMKGESLGFSYVEPKLRLGKIDAFKTLLAAFVGK
jgi:hypothetical protein